ncbi:hypothetical protein Aduo_014952 [Ancylostoma duodenale]
MNAVFDEKVLKKSHLLWLAFSLNAPGCCGRQGQNSAPRRLTADQKPIKTVPAVAAFEKLDVTGSARAAKAALRNGSVAGEATRSSDVDGRPAAPFALRAVMPADTRPLQLLALLSCVG